MTQYKLKTLISVYNVIILFINGVWGTWTVTTPAGIIQGILAKDLNYFEFLGIPYGKINKPFGLSEALPMFPLMFEANDDSVVCPQALLSNGGAAQGIGTVDCLRLNIYVPDSVSKDKSVPVIVFFHGGKFSYGEGSKNMYGPKYLVRHGIIFVTVNFRMGPYGFLCLNDMETPGNQGLKDQLLALRWIKKNIAPFGGDVNSITIMGESSGAKAADLHVHSNNEKLFHRMILQGGTAYSLPPDLTRHDAIQLRQIAEKFFSKKHRSIAELLYDFNYLDPTRLAVIAEKYPNFIPCVEPKFPGVESIINENPINLEIPKALNMSILIGYAADDQNINHIETYPQTYRKWNKFRDHLLLTFDIDEKKLSRLSETVKRFYLGDEKISYENRLDLGLFESDFLVMHPTERTIDKYLRNGARQVYYYVFSYIGGRNMMRQKTTSYDVGAVHADELGYLFDSPLLLSPNASRVDQLMIDRITYLWTNFAKFGDPTPVKTELVPVRWIPIVRGSPKYYMNIDKQLTIGKSPFYARMAFWDLFYETHEKLQYGYKDQKQNASPTTPQAYTYYDRQYHPSTLILDSPWAVT